MFRTLLIVSVPLFLLCLYRVAQSARVVLPTPADQDTDEEAEDEEHEAADNGDFLDVFPDDTEVRLYPFSSNHDTR